MRFWKWHALGNSYVLVERSALGGPLEPELARRLCDPRRGIGSDGVLEVVAAGDGRAEIAIWNPDGSVAGFSGNGTRIAAAWLAHRSGAARVVVEVGPRSYPATLREDGLIAMAVGDVEVGATETVQLDGERIELTTVALGNPHAVVRVEPSREALLRLGPRLETHARFPELTAAVWERGAGETSSSGSSAVAVASAAIANGWCDSPVTVHMPGGDLRIELDGENAITLVGPAEEICEGELRL
jgi:diaminopimelate epimerase